MRLTLDLIQQAPQSLNPASMRQLQLRGQKIPAIENLGSSNDAYECIDLTDNDIIKLGNFPPLKRLHVLLLTNNRISRIAEDCFDPLPNLVSITLTNNKLEKLVDLEPLTKLKTLERLSLLENPVTKVKHYRPYMINKCSKSLRILDFSRIKDKERKAAGLLFAGERGRKLLEDIAPPRTAGGKEPTEKTSAEGVKVGPSPEVIERIKKAIAEAETIEEVTRLERALKSGVLPDDLKGPEKVEEKPENEKKEEKAAEEKKEEPPKKRAREEAAEAAEAAEADGAASATKETEKDEKAEGSSGEGVAAKAQAAAEPADAEKAPDAAKEGEKEKGGEAMQVDDDEELE